LDKREEVIQSIQQLIKNAMHNVWHTWAKEFYSIPDTNETKGLEFYITQKR
jgi:hypothetical protein